MSDRPDWNSWILQKNAEFKQEELKKSDSVALEKATHARMVMPSPEKVAEFKAKQALSDPAAKRLIPKENKPIKGETQDAHRARVVGRLKALHPNMDPKHHEAAANHAWDQGPQEEEAT